MSCMSLFILNINFLFLISHFICKYCLLFSSLPFYFVMVSFAVQKLLSSGRSYFFFIFAFIFFTLGDIPKTDITIIYVKDCSAYIFLYEFYNIRSFLHLGHQSILSFFSYMVLENVLIYSFICSFPVF